MKAELIDVLGNDDTVVNAARVSFNKEADQYTAEQNKRLITYLATHGHFTPFTHAQITLRYTVPIFVARQETKHQIGFTRNEVSRRYVDDEPEFFVPNIWRSRPEGGIKQGSGTSTLKYLDRGNYDLLGRTIDNVYEELLTLAEKLYYTMVQSGVAPEQARMVLPQSMYTSYYITGSLAAFARFYKQRSDEHAQVEIQELAQQVGDIIRPLYPLSWSALVD